MAGHFNHVYVGRAVRSITFFAVQAGSSSRTTGGTLVNVLGGTNVSTVSEAVSLL